ncbi:MAG: phosphodiester glycosidase family protein [Elusimicrobia bacterium]|nr:phosphodiester glycosidase family protein [Elusimicrobiota bacterium]
MARDSLSTNIFALALLGAALCPRAALAGRTIAPGIAYSYSNGYHVVVADLASREVDVRVAMPHAKPADNMVTVARRAMQEDAVVAINANFFGGPINHPCGAARGGGVQYPGIYGEAANCETTMGWARGKGAVFNSAGHEADANFMSQFTELATGGGFLLQNGQPRDWNRTKLEANRACTAIGLSADRRKFIFVVTNSRACTGQGLQQVMAANGASDAIHLDGGGSSKMWLKGTGYVNDVSGERRPSVVIVAKSGGVQAKKCPADCGAAKCAQPAYPPVAQCVGRPCRSGLGAAWTCDVTMTQRVRCANGIVAAQSCAVSCMPDRSGGGDCTKCPSGNGLYCGGTVISGNKGTLYRCANGLLTEVRRCAKGCVRMPAGTNDHCE